MTYIVLELFSNPYVVCDEEGYAFTFENLEEAKKLAEECQQGMIVPLDTQLVEKIEQLGLQEYFL